jgi:hypothetical protein
MGKGISMLIEDFASRSTGKPLAAGLFRIDNLGYRNSLLEHFQTIHEHITCAHAPAEAWIVADAILKLDVPGPIVECGVYQGGFTAKLSRICRDVGRELYVCDCFSGIPASETAGQQYEHFPERQDVMELYGETTTFDSGEYCGNDCRGCSASGAPW